MNIINFRKVDQDIFEAIKDGRKKVETRANTTKFQKIKKDDEVLFSCDGESFIKKVNSVEVFENIDDLLNKYDPKEINPRTDLKEELVRIYYSFPGYKEKIEEYGIIAFVL